MNRLRRMDLRGRVGSPTITCDDQGSRTMQDILYIVIGLVFFLICIAYVGACAKLQGGTRNE